MQVDEYIFSKVLITMWSHHEVFSTKKATFQSSYNFRYSNVFTYLVKVCFEKVEGISKSSMRDSISIITCYMNMHTFFN